MDKNHSQTRQTHNRDVINILLTLSSHVDTVNYGSSFFPLRFMARAPRTWATKSKGKKTWSITYGTDLELGYTHPCQIIILLLLKMAYWLI